MFGRTNYQQPISEKRKERKRRRMEERNLLIKPGGLYTVPQAAHMVDNNLVPLPMNQNQGANEKLSLPDLVLYYGFAKNNRTYHFLKLSFEQANYPLRMDVTHENPFYVRLLSNNFLISEGRSNNLKEATQIAVVKAIKRLQSTNYAIEAKQTYYHSKRYPAFLRDVDSASSHIFKVVCLKKADGPDFVHPLTGAVDYVHNEEELLSYIENHCKSSRTVDLFVLNITKQQRTWMKNICMRNKWEYRNLLNCSDRGCVFQASVNIPNLFQELQKCGGENVKYLLIPPSSEDIPCFGDDFGFTTLGINKDTSFQEGVPQIAASLEELQKMQEKEIKVDPWISKHLIIVEYMTESNVLESAKELIFHAVKQCPVLEQFIVEKKRDKFTLRVVGEAMIDRKVVGRAEGAIEMAVKHEACQDALENLKKSCRYIQAKRSYFGTALFSRKDRVLKTDLYRIVLPTDINTKGDLERLLRNFRNQPIEDLFFLNDFPLIERKEIFETAKRMGFSVRRFADHWVCVFKKKNPRDLFTTLSKCKGYENEKYNLIMPQNGFDEQIEQPNEKSGLENLFDLTNEREKPNYGTDGGRNNLSGLSTQKAATKNISQLFDVRDNFKSSQEISPTNFTNVSVDPVGFSEKNKGNERITNISNLFDTVRNRQQDSDKWNKPSSDIVGQNLLKKERIIINPNCSYSSESRRNDGQDMKKLNQCRTSSEVSEKSNPDLPGQKLNSKKQPPDTRTESAYDHGDDVWLEDDFDVEPKMNSRSFHQQKNSPCATQTETQNYITQDSDNLNYHKNTDRMQENLSYNDRFKQNLTPDDHSSSANLSRISESHKKCGQTSNWTRSQVYPGDFQRSEEPPNKVAKLFDIEPESKSDSFNCKQNITDDHSSPVNQSRISKSQNKFGWTRRDQVYPGHHQRSEEPPNKMARLFDIEPDSRHHVAKSYYDINKPRFNQSSRLHQETGVVNERSKFHSNESDGRNFDRMGYNRANTSQSLRNVNDNQRTDNPRSKIFDMIEPCKASPSRSAFGKGYDDNYNGTAKRTTGWTGSGAGQESTPAQPSTHVNSQEKGKLWKSNIKQMFDQRRYN